MLTNEEKQSLEEKVSEYLNTKIKLHFNPNKGYNYCWSEYMPDISKSWFSPFIQVWIVRGEGQPIKNENIKFKYEFRVKFDTRMDQDDYPPFTFTLVLDDNGKWNGE